MYDQLVEKLLIEAVGISLSPSEQKFKDFYVGKPKYCQLDFKTAAEVRFWILGDGTIIRVLHDTHAQSAQEADVNYDVLRSTGALRGYSVKVTREIGVEGDVEVSSAQKTSLLYLVSKHMSKTVMVDDHSKGSYWTGSAKELDYFLQYGPIDEGTGELFGISEAGWIHPNGKLEALPNYSAGDHDKDAYKKVGKQGEYTLAYLEYLKQGHIRYIASDRKGFNVELRVKPTSSQMKAIRNGIEDSYSGDFYFSIRTARIEGSSYGVSGKSWKEFREEVAKL